MYLPDFCTGRKTAATRPSCHACRKSVDVCMEREELYKARRMYSLCTIIFVVGENEGVLGKPKELSCTADGNKAQSY